MTSAIRLHVLAAVASTGLSLSAPAQALQAPMSFFVTSVGKGNGADLGGLAGADAHCQALAKAAGFLLRMSCGDAEAKRGHRHVMSRIYEHTSFCSGPDEVKSPL
jgi:hypothetical protein